MSLLVLVAAMAFSAAAPGQGPSTPAPDQAAAATEKPAKEKKICRRTQVTGSYFFARECHTQAEWDAMTERAQESFARRRTGLQGLDMK
ncbi:hypothetical protein LZK98_04305 [Sphingomonas cannabina]|uniref:hypothetical protein n=1 Tax=Sphingomonas cannabina TaxID=2899123 RepID=UPI001F28CEBD|nr:hypothetical protein [Sphingomonas cannabina]UIJ46180.1 hypothetical protein LZK98_04305 [Sphingomonas cannabina]